MDPSQLTLISLLERAGQIFPNSEIVSKRPGDSTDWYIYGQMYCRARALAAALQDYGLRKGDRVATLMWNHSTHLEAYFGVPVAGGVLHALDLRLPPDELARIVNHAEDRFLIVDDVLVPLFEQIKDRVKLDRVIVNPFGRKFVANGYDDYEKVLQATSGRPTYPDLDENDPATLCYASGTTGSPKGVVYSHRAIALHAFSISLRDQFGIGRDDTILPAMPMFDATAWGLPYAAVMNGSNLVFPGPNLQPERILDLLATHQVTLTGGLPAIWLGVIAALEREPRRWHLAPNLRVIAAGCAVPETLVRRFDERWVRVIQAWGMTEMTPIATVCTLSRDSDDLTEDERYARLAKQGLPAPFIELRIVDDRGEVAWDGATPGELQVRGPWVASSYFKCADEANWSGDGWFHTGERATIDGDGRLKIQSRDCMPTGVLPPATA